jgi:hypothetical protein
VAYENDQKRALLKAVMDLRRLKNSRQSRRLAGSQEQLISIELVIPLFVWKLWKTGFINPIGVLLVSRDKLHLKTETGSSIGNVEDG